MLVWMRLEFFFAAFYFGCSAVFEICIVLVYSVVIVSYLLCFLVF